MWHASVAPQRLALSTDELRERALAALEGVGDRARGEWFEVGERAVHLRRRLSEREQVMVGPAVDVRRNADGVQRARRMAARLGSRAYFELEVGAR